MLKRTESKLASSDDNLNSVLLLEFFYAGILPKRDPPLSIPNREVKSLRSDDIICFGERESRICRSKKVLINKKPNWVFYLSFFKIFFN